MSVNEFDKLETFLGEERRTPARALSYSIRDLATMYGMSKSKVDRFLRTRSYLKPDGKKFIYVHEDDE